MVPQRYYDHPEAFCHGSQKILRVISERMDGIIFPLRSSVKIWVNEWKKWYVWDDEGIGHRGLA